MLLNIIIVWGWVMTNEEIKILERKIILKEQLIELLKRELEVMKNKLIGVEEDG